MNYRIAYGRDTESIEDPDQLVLLDLPDECSEMDTEELEEWIDRNWLYILNQPIVGVTDVMESLTLILDVETDGATAERILASLRDALTNNL